MYLNTHQQESNLSLRTPITVNCLPSTNPNLSQGMQLKSQLYVCYRHPVNDRGFISLSLWGSWAWKTHFTDFTCYNELLFEEVTHFGGSKSETVTGV